MVKNVYVLSGIAIAGALTVLKGFDEIADLYHKYTAHPAPLTVEVTDLHVYSTVGDEGDPKLGIAPFLVNVINFIVRVNERPNPTHCKYEFLIDPVFVRSFLRNPQPFEIPAYVSTYQATHWITFQPPSPFDRYSFRIECDGTSSNAVTFEVLQTLNDLNFDHPLVQQGRSK